MRDLISAKIIGQLKDYGIQNLNRVKQIAGGTRSINFLVKAEKNKYFLKKYSELSRERIQEIHSVLDYFYKEGIPSIQPIRDIKNGLSFFINEGSYFAIFPFIEITPVKKMTKKHIENFAKMLAQLHIAGDKPKKIPEIKNRPHFWDTKKFNRDKEMINKITKNKKTLRKIDEEFIEFIKLKEGLIDNRVKSEVYRRKTLIHGDYRPENVSFKKTSTIQAVFDFEKTNLLPREFEVIRTADLSFFNGSFTKQTFGEVSLFIKSYNKIYPLKKSLLEETINKYYYEQIYSLHLEKEHFIKNNPYSKAFLPLRRDTIIYISKNLKKLIGTICSSI